MSASLAPAGTPEDAFNFYLSSLRVHVEQSFGQLLARWRLLGMRMCSTVELNARLIHAATILHNYCIDTRNGNTQDLVDEDEASEILAQVRFWTESSEAEHAGIQSTEHQRSSVRDLIIKEISELELQRPQRNTTS